MSNSPTQASQENSDYSAGWSALFEMLNSGGSLSGRERNCCFLNTGSQPFSNVSAVAGFDFSDDGRGLAKVDWDQDGRVDIWTCNRTAPRARFFRNTSSRENHFIALKLRGTRSNRDAIGAKARLRLKDGRTLLQTVCAGAGYLSQSTKWLHFGLGKEFASAVEVTWPHENKVETFEINAFNNRYELVEGSGKAIAIPSSRSEVDLNSTPINQQRLPEQSRTVLAGRVPMFPFEYRDQNNRTKPFQYGPKPVLVNFWASWCQPCIEEIQAFANSTELNGQVEIMLLSGDTPGDRMKANQFLQELGWRGLSGFAENDLFHEFDTIQKSLFSHKQTMPVPTSFLIDANGKLAAIYKGKIGLSQLLADVAVCNAPAESVWEAAIPFPGKWIERPDAAAYSQMAVATEMTKSGNSRLAEKYLTSLTRRIDPEPLPEEAEARMTLAGAQLNLASQFFKQGNLEQALDLAREALRFAPNFVKAHFNVGVIHQELGNISAAVASFEQALNIDPNHPYSNFNLAIIHAANKPTLAANFYQRAIESDPEFTKARYNYGLFLSRRNRQQKASKQFLEILSYEENADAHFQLGNIALKTSQLNVAIDHFNRAIAIQGQHAEAMTNLAAAYFSNRQFDLAAEVLQHASEIQPGNPKVQFNYGIALLQMQKFDLAIAQFEKTLNLDAQYPAAKLRISQAISMKPDASITELKSALDFAQSSAKTQPETQAAAQSLIHQIELRLQNSTTPSGIQQ